METVNTTPLAILADPERISFQVTRGCAARVTANLAKSKVVFRRIGSSEEATYGIHEALQDGTLSTIVEDNFHKMRRGRWRAYVLLDGECCTEFDIDIGAACRVSNVTANVGGCC